LEFSPWVLFGASPGNIILPSEKGGFGASALWGPLWWALLEANSRGLGGGALSSNYLLPSLTGSAI